MSGVDGADDLGVVDALEVDRGDAEVGVAELALDDVQGHAFAGHLDDAERLCTRLGLMHQGRLVLEGSLPELREKTGCANLIDMFLKFSNGGPTLMRRKSEEATRA